MFSMTFKKHKLYGLKAKMSETGSHLSAICCIVTELHSFEVLTLLGILNFSHVAEGMDLNGPNFSLALTWRGKNFMEQQAPNRKLCQ